MPDNQQILTKAIEKAIANGWDYEYEGKFGDVPLPPEEIPEWLASSDYWEPELYIYQHSFAQALWGEEQKHTNLFRQGRDMPDGKPLWVGKVLPAWQYHLQQMVIADDPIKYLGEHS